MMDIILLVISVAAISAIGSVVYRQYNNHLYAKWFFRLCAGLVLWVISNYFTNHFVYDDSLVKVANISAYVSGLFSFYSGAMFSYYFPTERKGKANQRYVLTIIALSMSVISFTPFISGEITVVDEEIFYKSGVGLLSYLAVMTGFLLISIINLLYAARNGTSKSRAQSKIVIVAYSISGAIGLGLNVVLPVLGQGWDNTRIAPLSIVVLVVLVSYSIVRQGLFDVRLALVRTVAYSLSLATLASVYFILAYILSATIIVDLSVSLSADPVNVVLALVLAFIFQPIKRFFDRATNNIFFQDSYDSDEFIARLGEVLTSTTRLDNLLREAAGEIALTLKATNVSFVVFRGENDQTVIGSGRFPKFSDREYFTLRANLGAAEGPLVLVDEYGHNSSAISKERSQAIGLLRRRNISLVLVLADIGYLMLGEQKGRGYTSRDVRVLETVSDELVIAVQNARSVQEVEDLNKNLQERIDQATKELRTSNEKLKRLDATKDEFISMASHQLRTPLTSVKGYLSMVLEGDAGKLNDQQKHLLSEAYTSSERMVHLVGDFLNVSRVQTGKFVVDAKPTNLASVIADEVSAIERMAEAHGVSLIYHPPKKFPLLSVDEDKLRQVVMNFVDNAIYYSRDNSAIVIKVHATHDEAIVEVHDHGIGVPKAAQDRLFTKFFRADNARRQRPDGTGVGLFLAKKVVTAHGGEIIFESTEGRGSVFGFRLPIKKLKVDK